MTKKLMSKILKSQNLSMNFENNTHIFKSAVNFSFKLCFTKILYYEDETVINFSTLEVKLNRKLLRFFKLIYSIIRLISICTKAHDIITMALKFLFS